MQVPRADSYRVRPLDVEPIFDALPAVIPGLRRRAGQVMLAQAVADTLESSGDRLAAEAPTGTGKTVALLLPATALAGRQRTVVSTHSNILATRMAVDDLPRIRLALDSDADAVLLKGRNNYLCLERLHRNLPRDKADQLAAIALYRDGDLSRMGVDDRLGRRINDDRRFCLGEGCPRIDACYSKLARDLAKTARVVVTNHSILLADIVSFDNVLGSYDAVLLDEAHHIPEVAARSLLSRFDPAHVSRQASMVNLTPAALHRVQSHIEALGDLLRETLGGASRRVIDSEWPRFAEAAEELADIRPPPPDNQDETSRIAHGEWADCVTHLTRITGSLGNQNRVVYVDRDEHGPVLLSQPLRVSAFLRKFLYKKRLYDESGREVVEEFDRPVVATSATLRTVGNPDGFGYFLDHAGLTGARTLRVPSPFDPTRAALFLPNAAPLPPRDGSIDPAYVQRTAEEIAWAAKAVDGGTFVLTTSWAWLQAYAKALAALAAGPLYVQQPDGNNETLLNDFIQHPGILVGTKRYWEGIDIPGRALSLVVITKLPFPNTSSDPVLEARRSRLDAKRRGLGFNLVLLPEMILTLRQGVGRLIRTETDFGLILLLDGRCRTFPYGTQALNAIGYRVVRSRQQVSSFLAPYVPVQIGA